MEFGRPDARLDDDRVLVYGWERAVAWTFVIWWFPFPILEQYAVAIEFSTSGRISRVGRLSAFTKAGLESEVQRWVSGGRSQ